VVTQAIAALSRRERVTIQEHAVNVIVLPSHPTKPYVRTDRERECLVFDNRIRLKHLSQTMSQYGRGMIMYRRDRTAVYDITIVTFAP